MNDEDIGRLFIRCECADAGRFIAVARSSMATVFFIYRAMVEIQGSQ